MKLELVEDILESNQVTDEDGNTYELHSAISKAEGEFIYSLILENEIERSIEIGFAFGISSLYICNALSQKESQHHVIIDPYQSLPPWHGIGVYNLKKAGFSFFELVEMPSEIALPELLQRQETFDFAFIDGWHTFDHALLDFFYINRLLKVRGIVVYDDVDYPALKKLIRYISNYQNYEIICSLQYDRPLRHRIKDKVAIGISALVKLLPEWYTRPVFSDNVFRPDSSLGLNTSMIALRKTGHDERSWDWYAPF
ncbi:MAG: class I SAM-dependent methyltransferase [Desulfobacteraceae bacterium]|nr:class I SAM-dependent methyltransferase [Desulfobacteraceae bacterium]